KSIGKLLAVALSDRKVGVQHRWLNNADGSFLLLADLEAFDTFRVCLCDIGTIRAKVVGKDGIAAITTFHRVSDRELFDETRVGNDRINRHCPIGLLVLLGPDSLILKLIWVHNVSVDGLSTDYCALRCSSSLRETFRVAF